MTDVELDARVTALEENGGGGNSLNGKTNDLFNIMKEVYICRISSVNILIDHFNSGASGICQMLYIN